MRKALSFLALVVAGLLLAGSLFAQVPEAEPPAFDVRGEIAAAILLVTPVLVRLLAYGALFIVPRIPKKWLPFASVAIGWGGSYLSGLTVTDPILAATIGFASIGLREIFDRYLTKPLRLGSYLTVGSGDFVVKATF